MLRNKIVSTFKESAAAQGYNLYCGFAHRMQRSDLRLPAIWLNPLELTSVQGVEQGTLTYHATLYLLQGDKHYTEAQKEQLWAQMEEDAIRTIQQLGVHSPQIYLTEKISAVPGEYTLTGRQEISLQVECDVQIDFLRTDSLTDKTV